MEYETLRQLAGTWGLIYLVAAFVGIIVFTFRPGTKERADELAQIPLREDDPHDK